MTHSKSILSTNQILAVKRLVQSKYVKYYDIQLELIDHIASNIEENLRQSDKTFQTLLAEAHDYWSSDRIDKIVKSKKKTLRWSWTRRMNGYILSYFRLPRILLVLALTMLMVYVFHQKEVYEEVIGYFWFFIGGSCFAIIIYGCYLVYEQSHSYPPPLICVDSYYSVYGFWIWIPIVLSDVVSPQWITTIEHFWWFVPAVSFGLVIYMVMMYATVFVFPRWLKRDTLQYYQHLDIA